MNLLIFGALKEVYVKELNEYNEIKNKIKLSYGDETERARRIDLLQYQKNEIEASKLKCDEEDLLIARRNLIMNSEKIVKSLAKSHIILDDNVMNGLGEVTYELSQISEIDENYKKLLESVNDAYYTLKDASSYITGYIDEVDFDEREQSEIEERLDVIFMLKRKYGNSIPEILEYLKKITSELEILENSEEIVEKLKKELSEKEKNLLRLSDDMRKIRIETSKVIEEKINEQLSDLEMKKAFIKFEFKASETFLENGKDIIRIMICTNVGEGLKPLAKIASGGELSRVMLAMKTILCGYDNVPTMIFDEIDTGISGQAANAVAEKMQIIGKTHQVICVTHLPVIAAAGNANYFIEKFTKNERTITKITRLSEEETIKEIARILAGNDLSEAALNHAMEMRKLANKNLA